MSTTATRERDLPKVEAALNEQAGSSGQPVSGPVTLLAASPGQNGGRAYEVSTTVLLPVDAQDPALRDVAIPVPVTATVELDRKGAVRRVAVPPVDPESAHEAQAYARNLIRSGAVEGLPPSLHVRRSAGPPRRPTHELHVQPDGTRVIRRRGLSISG